MSADLTARARSAVTVDDECSVLRAAVCHFVGDAMQALPLIDIIVAVRSGRAPRAVLLGVVAALVPEGMTSATIWGDAEKASSKVGPNEVDAASVPWSRAGSPALALLIAIREASNAE